jgi:hypothetical protein
MLQYTVLYLTYYASKLFRFVMDDLQGKITPIHHVQNMMIMIMIIIIMFVKG